MSRKRSARRGAVGRALCALLLYAATVLPTLPARATGPNKPAPARTAAKPSATSKAVKPSAPAPKPPARPDAGTPAPAPTEALVDTSVPPPSLPRASREKMRACAEEWGKMKLTTKSGLPLWRDFATSCLTRK